MRDAYSKLEDTLSNDLERMRARGHNRLDPTDPVDNEFKGALKELDLSEVHVVVRRETRRFSKPVTIIQGLSSDKDHMRNLIREMKRKLATGGSVKDGIVLLQGDQRDKVKGILTSLGYPEESIEVQ